MCSGLRAKPRRRASSLAQLAWPRSSGFALIILGHLIQTEWLTNEAHQTSPIGLPLAKLPLNDLLATGFTIVVRQSEILPLLPAGIEGVLPPFKSYQITFREKIKMLKWLLRLAGQSPSPATCLWDWLVCLSVKLGCLGPWCVCVCVFECTSRGVAERDGQRVTEVNGKSAKPKSHTHPPLLPPRFLPPMHLSIHPVTQHTPPHPHPQPPPPLRSSPGCSSLSPSRCPWSCGPAQWWTCLLYTSDCSQRHVPVGRGRGQERGERDSVYLERNLTCLYLWQRVKRRIDCSWQSFQLYMKILDSILACLCCCLFGSVIKHCRG